jgi:hypothetical protein
MNLLKADLPEVGFDPVLGLRVAGRPDVAAPEHLAGVTVPARDCDKVLEDVLHVPAVEVGILDLSRWQRRVKHGVIAHVSSRIDERLPQRIWRRRATPSPSA